MFCVYDKLSYTTLVFISLSKLEKTEERTVFPNVEVFFMPCPLLKHLSTVCAH